MAELDAGFVSEHLSSWQLLALLFVCESRRKKRWVDCLGADGSVPPGYDEFVERFAARLARLPETERLYLIGSHLQSAEDVDIYSNGVMNRLLSQDSQVVGGLAEKFKNDPRFLRR